MKGLGRQLVVSLANIMISPQTNDKDGMTVTARALEGMGIEWLGLHAKKHHILVGRERVGLLAFCGVHRECGKTTDLPFGPVKYSLKVAKSAINELKEVDRRVILDFKDVYWPILAWYITDCGPDVLGTGDQRFPRRDSPDDS